MFQVDKQAILTGETKPQCCVLDDHGMQCHDEGYRVEMYFGDPKLAHRNPDSPKWALVPMCKKHSAAAP